MSNNKRLDQVLNVLNKQFGEGVIKRASDLPPMRTMPVGIAAWDDHLGGGFLWGRMTSLAGKKSSGKTSIGYKASSVMQNLGGVVFWFDVEKQYDPQRAKIFGVNADDVIVFNEEWTSEILFQRLISTQKAANKAGLKCLYVVDSLTATMKESLSDEEGSAAKNFGGSANINNQIITVSNSLLRRNQILIYINHLRDNLSMGDPNILPGGRAQEYLSSAMIWTGEGKPIKDGDASIGFDMTWTVKKSRSSPPKSRGEVAFYYATGFDLIASLVETAVAYELIKGSGWYELPDGIKTPDGANKVQGKDRLIEMLREHPEILNALKAKVYSQMPISFWDGEGD